MGISGGRRCSAASPAASSTSASTAAEASPSTAASGQSAPSHSVHHTPRAGGDVGLRDLGLVALLVGRLRGLAGLRLGAKAPATTGHRSLSVRSCSIETWHCATPSRAFSPDWLCVCSPASASSPTSPTVAVAVAVATVTPAMAAALRAFG